MAANFLALIVTLLLGLTLGFPVDASALMDQLERYETVVGPPGAAMPEDDRQKLVEEAGLNQASPATRRTAMTDLRSILQWYSATFAIAFAVGLALFRPTWKSALLAGPAAIVLFLWAGAVTAIPYLVAYIAYATVWLLFLRHSGLSSPRYMLSARRLAESRRQR